MAKLTSSETIANLSVLLDAIRAHKKPQQEAELYAKRKMIDLKAEKDLFTWKREQDALSGASIALLSQLKGTGEHAKATRRLRRAERKEEGLKSGKSVIGLPGLLTGAYRPFRSEEEQLVGKRKDLARQTVKRLEGSVENVEDTFIQAAATMQPGDAVWNEYKQIYLRQKALINSLDQHSEGFSKRTNKRLDWIKNESAYSTMTRLFEGEGKY